MSHAATKWAFDQALRFKEMPPAELLTLVVLADCHNPVNGCFPSQRYVSSRTNLTVRSVHTQLKRLRDRGLINWDAQRRRDGRRGLHRYHLAFEEGFTSAAPAESAAADEPPEKISGGTTGKDVQVPPENSCTSHRKRRASAAGKFVQPPIEEPVTREPVTGEGIRGNGEALSLRESQPPILDDSSPSQIADAAVVAYNHAAAACDWPPAQRLTARRKTALLARIGEAGGLSGWQSAMQKASESSFLNGQDGRSATHPTWRPDLDFFIRQDKFTRLMEGTYDHSSHRQRLRGHDAMIGALMERAEAWSEEAAVGVAWVTTDHGRWPEFAARYEREHGRPPFAAGSKYFAGIGFGFPADWVGLDDE